MKMIILRLILLVFWFLWLVFYPVISFAQTERDSDNKSYCIQVITPATNPETGKCENFATPCDVPEGWIRVDKCSVQINIPIQIKIPKPELRLPVVAEQPRAEGKTTEISSEPAILKENKEIQIKLKTRPQAIVSEEMPVSAIKALRSAVREKIVDLPREPVTLNGEVKEPLFEVELPGSGKEVAYKIKGVKHKRVFGLIPVAIQKDVFVSAKSGRVIDEQMTFFNRLLEKLSF
ncbi:MAG: hypothetical protein HYV39_03080 [Candidatus Levybacteria bacterium]|nr:hypothetical protein [Candidatus Levybacteria bacterium]